MVGWPGLGTGSRLQSADPSVWISSGRIAPGPFEVAPKAREVLGGSVKRAALPGPKVLEPRLTGGTSPRRRQSQVEGETGQPVSRRISTTDLLI